MKKFLGLLCASAMCLSLIACSGQSAKDAEASPTADPVAEAKTKLSNASRVACRGAGMDEYAILSKDHMSLTIDTNPKDVSHYRNEENALNAIYATNKALGLPSSLDGKMSSTRAIDGMQTQNCGIYTVTWTYHPDNGLNVIYEVNP